MTNYCQLYHEDKPYFYTPEIYLRSASLIFFSTSGPCVRAIRDKNLMPAGLFIQSCTLLPAFNARLRIAGAIVLNIMIPFELFCLSCGVSALYLCINFNPVATEFNDGWGDVFEDVREARYLVQSDFNVASGSCEEIQIVLACDRVQDH